MSRALRFTKAEIANAAMIARDMGVSVNLRSDGSILVFPAKHMAGPVDLTEDEDLDAELAAFEAKNGYR